MNRIVIIGAGHAGIQAAASLRTEGYTGRIVMISEESAPPYQRPPLSKSYLEGGLEQSRLYLKPQAFYETSDIELKLGLRATTIDRAHKQVRFGEGEELGYDSLLIATGAPPRHLVLPGSDLPGVHTLRTLQDSDALRPLLGDGGRLVIVGGGYVGLEVAAVARKAGVDVVVLEAADRILKRVAGVEVSAYFAALHRRRGVDLRLNVSLAGFEGRGRVEAAVLEGGESIPCTGALVAVGALPSSALAQEAGLLVDNGVVVDETARTSDPSIWAAGDCSNFPSALYGRRLRLESVPNAIEQAKVAAANMAGRPAVYDAVPWFWSDQYDVKLQTAGISYGADETVVRGDIQGGVCSVWYLKGGRLIAVDAMNDVPAFAVGKRLIAARAEPERIILADTSRDLKPLLI